MRILEDPTLIGASQERFKHSLDGLGIQTFRATIGFQSGSVRRDVLWIPSLDMWAHFGDPPRGKSNGARYWNAFGLSRPEGMVSIVCEINPPLAGINRHAQGVFLIDENQQTWVAHRGWFNIVGGMTKEFFRIHYSKPYVRVEDGNQRNKVIVVGRIGDAAFPRALREFVGEVHRIKTLARRSRS